MLGKRSLCVSINTATLPAPLYNHPAGAWASHDHLRGNINQRGKLCCDLHNWSGDISNFIEWNCNFEESNWYKHTQGRIFHWSRPWRKTLQSELYTRKLIRLHPAIVLSCKLNHEPIAHFTDKSTHTQTQSTLLFGVNHPWMSMQEQK